MEKINVCGNVWGNESIFLEYSKPNALTLFIILAVVKEDIQIIFKSRQRVISILHSFLKIFAALDNLRIHSTSVVQRWSNVCILKSLCDLGCYSNIFFIFVISFQVFIVVSL